MSKTVVLVVDDEPTIRKNVSAILRSEGCEPIEAINGLQAVEVMELRLPSLIILDINMPNMDGFKVIQRIREWSEVPIIMVSGRLDEQDKVRALRSGADDYLTKPYGLDELLARVEAVLRRSTVVEAARDEPTVTSGDLQVNLAERTVTLLGQNVDLTPTEYNLLRELVLNRGKMLTHRTLLQQVWGAEYGDETEYVRVFISRLRRKLGDDSEPPRYIKTEAGVGYRFLVPR